MGWGLWLVSELCRINKGELDLFSEGRYLQIRDGKTLTKDCGYWRGTIIRLQMPLGDPKTVSSIGLSRPPSIRINWGDN
jgi:hypothetical protein